MRMRLFLAAALAAAAFLGAGPATNAEAAPPQPSPFAGTYSGYPPGVWTGFTWPITISSRGDVSGSVYFNFAYWYENGTLKGKVDGTGEMSCRGNWTYTVYSPDSGSRTFGGPIRFKASVSLDGSGNLVGTADDGTTFTWYRQ